MSEASKIFGDDEIDKIAGEIDQLTRLRNDLNKLNLADSHEVIPLLDKMKAHSQYVKDYFKPSKIPN